MLTLFNSGDVIARILAMQRHLMVSLKTTKILTFIRLIFFATFLPIAFQCPPKQLFGADWFIMINTFVFGMSHGYCLTMCAMLAPSTVREHLRQECGLFIAITSIVGMTVGSAIDFGLTQLIDIHTPDSFN